MQIGVERFSFRIHHHNLMTSQRDHKGFVSQLNTFNQGFDGFIGRVNGRQRTFQVIHHRQQIIDDFFKAVFVSLLDILLGTAANVLHIGLGAQ